MDPPKTPPSRLFVTTAVENRDEIEEKLERSYQYLQSLTAGLSDKDAHDALHNALLRENGYEEISFGLLVTILTEPQNAAKGYRDLTLITRDGFSLVVNHLTQLVLERYLRFNDIVRAQLLWLLREMIKNAVTNVDNLCWHLLRHAAGGDISPRNITLIESLLDVFIEYRSWLDKFPVLLASVVYTYLRLIEDHNSPYLASLRQKEVTFLISIIRERFGECLVIGRDLVRLLQNVARIPEFDQLWRDILLNPKVLSPQFTGVLQLLQTRTSRRFLQSRLTPEMERKLVFLTSQVRFGNHKRYQDWFQRQYLATPESQSLRCDMIRFIVGVIHPTNELLCSDIIPRWAVIGWLLTTCTSNVAVSNAKLALFYDWFFFDSEKDNIMNIEPAILVMHHSMRSHPAVSATLLDFLCRIITNFYPPLTEKVRNGIFSSLRQILDKRVLPSLLPLFDNLKLDRELRNMIRETFKEFCVVQTAMESSSKIEDFNMSQPNSEGEIRLNHNHHVLDNNEPAFSDDEDEQQIVVHPPEDDTDDDDIPLAKVRLKEKTLGEDVLIDSAVRTSLNRLQSEKDRESRCSLVVTFVQNLIEAEPDDGALKAIAKLMCNCVQDDVKDEVCPKEITETTLLDSIKSPLFSLIKATITEATSTGKELLYRLLAEMYAYLPSIGYLLLYYLKVQVRTETRKDDQPLKVGVYKEFCQALEKKLDVCLYDDLSACHCIDNNLMMWLVPDLYRDFKQQTVSNTQVMRVIVSTIDPLQLQDLVSRIMQRTLVMLKNDNVQPLLKASLTWESIEQFFLWQLVQAHDIPLETITPLLPHLDSRLHSEAVTAIVLLLKRDRPTADIIKHLFSRDVRDSGDNLIFTVIKYWCDECVDKVGELISGLLSTRYPATSPNKRKRSGNKSLSSTVPSADQVLGHLNHIRSYSEKLDSLALYNVESVQRALQLAYSNSSDSQKKQFSELFALTEEEETSSTKAKGGGRGRKPGPKPKKTPKDVVSESSEESSEEEEIVKPKQAKKRKKVMSDSD